MLHPDVHLPLGYTPQWIALGIVSSEDVHRDEQEALAGDDPHPEHYRWRAFSRFVTAQSTLTLLLAQQLYSLGASDSDSNMGGSMMAAVLRHAGCPAELFHSALVSQHSHLRRIAARRLQQLERAKDVSPPKGR